MTSQSEATCLLRFLRQYVDFGCSFQKTKKCRIICSICDTITPAWLNRSVRLSSAAKFKSVFTVWCWTWYRCVYTALRIITNHTRCCWAYECKDQSEAFRWVIAEILVFSSLARWLKTSFWRPCVLLMTAFVPQDHICVYVYKYTHITCSWINIIVQNIDLTLYP